MTTSNAYDRILAALESNGSKIRHRGGNQASAQCPAHDDGDPSLSLTRTDGQALLHCHAGCDTGAVLSALGMLARDLFDNPKGVSYRYESAALVRTRTVNRTPAKKFTQKVESCEDADRTTIYRLPAVVDAVENGQVVYLAEGEKDVHALEALDVVATTTAMGAINVHKADLRPLYDGHVVAIVDKDDAGQKWAATVHDMLDGKVKSLTFKQAATGKDAADHVAAHHALDELVDLELHVDDDDDLPLRRARITWASQIEPEPVVWAWEPDDQGRIPAGSLSIAAGREGTGKSSFGIWLAAQITQGTLPGSYFGTPRRVFYVAVEDSWKHTLVPRLMAAGADLTKIGRFEVVSVDDEEVTLSLPHDNALLEREVQFHDVALVVIDPLMSVIGERIDTHREREVRSALDPLAKIADRTGSVFLGIAHFNKGGGTDAASLITGSGAFKNVPRSVFGFAKDESDEQGGRVMSQVKNSLGRDDLPSLAYVIESADVETRKGIAVTGRLAFTGESERSVADIIRDSRGNPDDLDERRDAGSWIKDYLTAEGGQALAGEVIAAGKAAGYGESTLKNARRKVATTNRTGYGKDQQTYWTLAGTTAGLAGTTDQTPVPARPQVVPAADPTDVELMPTVTDRSCADCGGDVYAGYVRCTRCIRAMHAGRSA